MSVGQAAHPSTAIKKSKESAQPSRLQFPYDYTLDNNWCAITFYEYARGNPLQPPKKENGQAIYLPIPFSGMEDNIKLDYSEVALGAAIGGALGTAGGPGGFVQKAASWWAGAGLGLATTAAGAVADAAGGKAGKAAAEQAMGVINNPNMSLSFKGVDLRKHTFSWRLIAKTPEESGIIEKILNTFKTSALPRKTLGASVQLSYPKIAYIEFSPRDIIKVSRLGCFLDSVSIKYDGDGHPAFYKGTGDPVIVDLTLHFTERSIMTAEDFMDENALSTQRSKNNGAIIGAAVGSVAGPIGTVVGGAIGAAVGASSKPSTNNKGKV
jgi:hypothetical protein